MWILRLEEFFTLFIQGTHSVLTGGPSLSTTPTSQETTHSGADVGSLGRSILKQDRAALGVEPPGGHTDLSRICSHLVDILFQLLLPGEVPELPKDRSRHVHAGGSLNWVFPNPRVLTRPHGRIPPGSPPPTRQLCPLLLWAALPPTPRCCLAPLSHQPSPSSALFFLCPGLGLQPLSSHPQGGVPHLPGSYVVPATPLSQSIVLITARNGTSIGEGREQRPLTVRRSMAAPTYAGGDGRRELRLLCLLP